MARRRRPDGTFAPDPTMGRDLDATMTADTRGIGGYEVLNPPGDIYDRAGRHIGEVVSQHEGPGVGVIEYRRVPAKRAPDTLFGKPLPRRRVASRAWLDREVEDVRLKA